MAEREERCFSDDHLFCFNHNVKNSLYVVKVLLETHLERISGLGGNTNTFHADTKKVLEKTLKEIERLFTMMNRLNQITSAANRGMLFEPELSEISISDVFHRVTAVLHAERAIEHISLVESIPADLPRLLANPLELEEIFYNLIVNAAQAMLDGGQLIVKAERDKGFQRRIRISFIDSGIGISEAALPFIFEPFVTGKDTGSGFGLYITKQLVKRNGGRIAVESRECFGSNFTLIFPVQSKNRLFSQTIAHVSSK